MEMMADLKRTNRVAVLQGWNFVGDAVADHIFMRIYCIHSKWVNQGNKNLGTFYLLRKGGFEAQYGFQNLAFVLSGFDSISVSRYWF